MDTFVHNRVRFSTSLVVWIRLPGLLEGMYKRSLLKFIGSATGPILKIDRNTDNKSRGKFTRLAIYIDLGKLLVSKLQIDGRVQRVEYEPMSMGYLDTLEMHVCIGLRKEIQLKGLLLRTSTRIQRLKEGMIGASTRML